MDDSQFEQAVAAEAERLRAQHISNEGSFRLAEHVDEEAAARLLGYSGADTLRKQVAECRDHPDFTRIGNRRFYAITDIAKHIFKGRKSYNGK